MKLCHKGVILLGFMFTIALVLFHYTRPEPRVDIITVTDTIPGDSIPYEVEVKIPVPFYVYDTIWDTEYISTDIDTAAIVADYLKTKYYNDTLLDDSSALIILEEWVQSNRVQDRKLFFQNRRVTSISNTNINYPSKKYFDVGVSVGFNSVIPSIGYNWSKHNLGIGYNLLDEKGLVIQYKYKFDER